MPKIISKNPAKNFEKLGEVNISSNIQIQRIVKKAKNAQDKWANLPVQDRMKCLNSALELFNKTQKELALLITKEVGKPIKESKEEVVKSLSYFQYYLDHAVEYLSEETTYQGNDSQDILIYEPVGVTAVIVPWNYPFMLAIWGIIPNLLVGNSVVFKHSEYSPLVGKFIEDVFKKSKLPNGVFNEIYGHGVQGEFLAKQDIDLIWFTGSSKVGRNLYSIASKKIIKVVLEMGGSNPAIVFDDVDIKKVAKQIFSSRFKNCGQYCNAVKRVIAQKSIFNKLVSELAKLAEDSTIGNPEVQETSIGSMISLKQRKLLQDQLQDALRKGAILVYGGKIPESLKGACFQPTILTEIKKDMRVWREEVFGPLLPIVSFETEQQAVAMANDTEYGLGAQVFCKDMKKALRIAKNINVGMVDINGGKSSKYCNPFGGNKSSGMGREHGKHGFRELCKLKVISKGK